MIDTPQESNELDKAKVPLPSLQGDVSFENLSFTFSKGSPPVLNDVDLHVKAGTFVGIVGAERQRKKHLNETAPQALFP